jgi:ATP-binding cassette subfamily B protein
MADEIYLVKDGKIVEQGTHEQMMALNGYYHEMFMLQAENYQDSLPEEIMKGAAAFYG